MHKYVFKTTNELYKGWLPDMIVAILLAIASLFATTYDVLGLVSKVGQPLSLIIYYIIIAVLSYPITYSFIFIYSLVFHKNKKIISIMDYATIFL